MRLHIVAVGKLKDRELRVVLDDYYRRTRRYVKVEETEVRDGKESEVVERLTRLIGERARVVALEVNGEPLSSRELATWFDGAAMEGVQSLVFLIGGAYGLPRQVSKAADLRLSLSAMTLPHRLARVVLAEQIYRAYTIIAGDPYNH